MVSLSPSFSNVLFLFPEITGLIKCARCSKVTQTNAHKDFKVAQKISGRIVMCQAQAMPERAGLQGKNMSTVYSSVTAVKASYYITRGPACTIVWPLPLTPRWAPSPAHPHSLTTPTRLPPRLPAGHQPGCHRSLWASRDREVLHALHGDRLFGLSGIRATGFL